MLGTKGATFSQEQQLILVQLNEPRTSNLEPPSLLASPLRGQVEPQLTRSTPPTAHLLSVQDAPGSTSDCRAQERPLNHWNSQLGRPVRSRSPPFVPSSLEKQNRFLNIKLDNISVLDEDRHPHMVPAPPSSPPLPATALTRNDTRRSRCATALFEDRWCGTFSCPRRRWTRSCWRMLRGGVSPVCFAFLWVERGSWEGRNGS